MTDDSKKICANLSKEETPLRRSPRKKNNSNSDSNETSTQSPKSKRLSHTENSNLKQETSSDQEALMEKISEICKTSVEDEDALSLKRNTRKAHVKRDVEQSIPRRITRSQSNFSKTESHTEEENTPKLNTIEEETHRSENLTNTQPEDDSLINQQLLNDNMEERNTENKSQETQSDYKLSNSLNDHNSINSSNTTLISEKNSFEQSLIHKENGLETSQVDDSKHSDYNGKTFTSVPVSTLNTNGQVIDDENNREELSDTEKIKDKEKQDDRTETIKQRYSQLIDSTDIDYKIDELLSVTCSSSDGESEYNRNEFLDSMAEEGEEDTPSEGSNDIIEVGEEINTTESELSTDESYESNSFIDDEEECRLLSGDEFDLSLEEPKKKSRIIQLDCESDDEIIMIERPKRERKKNPKKSRIIRMHDSSDEDVEVDVTTVENKDTKRETVNGDEDVEVDVTTVENKDTKGETVHGDEDVDVDVRTVENKDTKGETVHGDEDEEVDVTTVENKDTKGETVHGDEDEEVGVTTVENKDTKGETVHGDEDVEVDVTTVENKDTKGETVHGDEDIEIDVTTVENKEKTVTEDTENDFQVANDKEEITDDSAMDSRNTDKDRTEILTQRSSTPMKAHEKCDIDSEIDNIDTAIEQSNSNEISTSSGAVFVNITMQIVGQEVNISKNINIEDTGKLPLNEHVKNIIDSFSGSIDDASELSIKLSAHYLDSESNEKHPNDYSIIENVDERKNNLLEKSKKKNKINSQAEALRDYFKTVSKPSQQNLKHHEQLNEVAKKRGTKRKRVSLTNNTDSSEEAPVKKKNKKRRHRKSTENHEVVQMGILDEVMASNKTHASFTNDDWDMEDIAGKPVSFNKSQTKKKEDKLKLEKNGNSVLKKFSSKDFKNAMLFDPSRVNRVVTKQVLKKRGIQLQRF